jgi:predicted MFS family arabinose efflux permease
MSAGGIRNGVFAVAWLNNYATSFYLNYLFFFMREEFGFGNRENLFLAAVNGFVYTLLSLVGGKFAQRQGYFTSLLSGLAMAALPLAIGPLFKGVAAHFAIMIVWTVGVCFTWPAIEALVSENQTRASLSRTIGMYNVVWSSAAAASYFTGGALISALGPKSLFWVAAIIHGLQFILTLVLRQLHNDATSVRTREVPLSPEIRPPAAKTFLRMAWLANPFAYIAMNTVIPLVPDLAAELDLTKAQAGFVASVWMFARLFSFVLFWQWTGWHYRFSWLAGAFGMMIVSFALLLLVPKLMVIVLAQLTFGLAVGLIYYSSLFYSMDVGETKAEHGGLHEAMIGIGIFVGPAVGAAALQFTARPNAGIWAVSALLAVGWAGLFAMGRKRAPA